jgi:HD superfamily phosphodiesterase
MRPQEALRLAQTYLADADPRRWRHVQGVGNRASAIASSVGDSETLSCAAWLHDIGYAPNLAVTGFHPLDGARFLESIAAPRRIVDLVAHHSCARPEAEMRGLGDELASFADEEGAVRDALWYCDITTSPMVSR